MRDKQDPAPADDPGRPGGRIEDPLLRVIRAGPDREPGSGRVEKKDTGPREVHARRRGVLGWVQVLGPGLVTGASDDDPSGIGTYSQVGSQFGNGLLWTPLFTFPLMAAVQELCARIALQTGVGLATALRRRFPAWLVLICVAALFIANTINAGADLGAVAAGGSLLTRGAVRQLWLVVPVAVQVLGLQLFLTYGTLFKIFKWLTVALFAYVIEGFIVHPNVGRLFVASVVPHVELI